MKRQSFMLGGAGALLAGCAAPSTSTGLLATDDARRTKANPDSNTEGMLLGSLMLSPYDFVPEHFAACEGQLIPIDSNVSLFSLLGNTFGGDGKKDFGLPDMRGKAPLKGLSYLIVTKGIYPTRKNVRPNFYRTEQLLGQLSLVAYLAEYVPPKEWEVCDGRLLNIRDEIALYSLLGTKFGGDGKTTFALPDLRKHELLQGITYLIARRGKFPASR